MSFTIPIISKIGVLLKTKTNIKRGRKKDFFPRFGYKMRRLIT